MIEFTLNSIVHDYYIYRDVWNTSVRETVNCERESRNLKDTYTVALLKDGVIVGHVPRTISCMYTLYFKML